MKPPLIQGILRDTDALIFGSKERYELNDFRMDANLAELGEKARDDCLKATDDSSTDDENETVGSPMKGDHKELSHLIINNGTLDSPRKASKNELTHRTTSWDKDADSLSSDSYDMEKEQGSPDCESLDAVEEFKDCNGSDSQDSSFPLFTDKNVLECDLPELEVCNRGTDSQNLRDICVDEGRPEKDVNMSESCFFPLPANDIDHLEAEEEPSVDADTFTADQCGDNEINEGKHLISQKELDSSTHSSFDDDTIKHCKPENTAETSEACIDGTDKAETDNQNSLVDRKVSDDFGNQNSLGTVHVRQLPGQVLTAASTPDAEGAGKDDSSCLAYNSKVENGIIIFNFSSPNDAAVGDGTDDVTEQFANLGDVVHKGMNVGNPPPATVNGVNYSLEQSVISSEGNSDCGTATSYNQCITNEDSGSGNSHEGSSKHKLENYDDISIDDDDPVQSPSNKTTFGPNDAHAPNHDEEYGDVQVVNQLQRDMGETSFSAASMITYSGPIAFSGSLSHRSDGSTTSGKSFAFPVLQSEWNSSPVRMAKADRRDFRKHKGWRSGLLCCRF